MRTDMTIQDLVDFIKTAPANFDFNQWFKDAVEQTLPIMTPPFYLGRDIKVLLSDEAETAYYDMMADTITISTRLLYVEFTRCLQAVVNKTGNWQVFLKWFVEEVLRVDLFHETLHAMLTSPEISESIKGYGSWGDISIETLKNIVNIVEDERIEQRGKGFFLRTDFEACNSVLFNANENPTDAEHAFLLWVRAHDTRFTTAELVQELTGILIRHKDLNRDSIAWSLDHYVCDIRNLFIKFAENWNMLQQAQQQNQQGQSQTQNGGNGSGKSEDEDEEEIEIDIDDIKDVEPGQQGNPDTKTKVKVKGSPKEAKEGENKDGEGGEPGSSSTKSDSKDTKDSKTSGGGGPGTTGNNGGEPKEGNKPEAGGNNSQKNDPSLQVKLPSNYAVNIENGGLVKQLNLKTYDNPSIERELRRIFTARAKSQALRQGARGAYNGRFNPQALERPYENEGKLWIRAGEGTLVGPSGFHLNTFIDHSGSMRPNTTKINELVKALTKLEKKVKNFSWTWIGCGVGQKIYATKKDRPKLYTAHGDTELKNTIFKQFEKVQAKDKLNLNVVLYDGWACGCSSWAAFNTPNTIIISDSQNEDEIMTACSPNGAKPKCRIDIISGNYADELEKVLIRELERLTASV